MITKNEWENAIAWAVRNEGKPTLRYEYVKNDGKYMLDQDGERIQVTSMQNNIPVQTNDTGEQLIMHFFREKVLDPKNLGSVILVKSGKYEYYRIKKVIKVNNNKKEIIVQDKVFAEALRKMQEAVNTYQNQQYTGDIAFSEDDGLYDACIKWYTHYSTVKKRSNNTASNYITKIAILQRDEMKEFANKKIKEYTSKDFQKLSDKLKEMNTITVFQGNKRIVGNKKYSSATLSGLWWVIKRTHEYLRQNYVGYYDVLENVTVPFEAGFKKEYKKYNVFDEISMLIFEKVATERYANGKPYFKHGDALVFLMYSGLRKGECCGLSKADFTDYDDEFKTGKIVVNKQIKLKNTIKYDENGKPILNAFGKPKKFASIVLSKELKTRGSNRIVPLSHEAALIARNRIKESKEKENDFLFKPFYRKDLTSKQREFEVEPGLLHEYKDLKGKLFLDPQDLNRSLEAVLKNCMKHPCFNKYNDFNIEAFTVHDLRHTAISHALRKGMSVFDAARFAGHTDINTTNGYYDQISQQLQEHAKMLSSAATIKKEEEIKTQKLQITINNETRYYDESNKYLNKKDFKDMIQGFANLQKDESFLRGTEGKVKNNGQSVIKQNVIRHYQNVSKINKLIQEHYDIDTTIKENVLTAVSDLVFFPSCNEEADVIKLLSENNNKCIRIYGLSSLKKVSEEIIKMVSHNFSKEEITDYIDRQLNVNEHTMLDVWFDILFQYENQSYKIKDLLKESLDKKTVTGNELNKYIEAYVKELFSGMDISISWNEYNKTLATIAAKENPEKVYLSLIETKKFDLDDIKVGLASKYMLKYSEDDFHSIFKRLRKQIAYILNIYSNIEYESSAEQILLKKGIDYLM